MTKPKRDVVVSLFLGLQVNDGWIYRILDSVFFARICVSKAMKNMQSIERYLYYLLVGI